MAIAVRELTALRESLKQQAASLGFDACAIAGAGEPLDPFDRLGGWLAAGYYADMRWMEETKAQRQNIRAMLPGAESVVVLALNYYYPGPSGRIARYARGRDYHKVLKKKLRQLARWLGEQAPESHSWTCVDSGPALERAWAARAGLGWIGKNSLVLRRDIGSWFFLGLLATTLRLEPDAPLADHCGSCRACLDACPTSAFPQPGVLDSNRCISYHTIENRGDVPPALAAGFGEWVFGCDICQEVCPWNRFARTTAEPDFTPRPAAVEPSLLELATQDRAGYEARFEGTPVRRAKHEMMQRNALIALANSERAE